MPLPKRCVEPVLVSRGTVPDRLNVPSELEAVTNGTLANTVRQLSSLSKHAEDMFGELTRDASALADRTNLLQARIDRLAIRVTQLDSGVEEVSLQDIQMRKAFRSARNFKQQIFSRGSMPSAMLDTYSRCDPPPPLERLNEFRDDGRDARKFYTDPDYFFDLWRREMLQESERIQHDRGKKVRQPRTGTAADGRVNRRVRAPHSTREKQKAAAAARGEHIMPQPLGQYNRQEQQYREPSVVDGRGAVNPNVQYRSTQQRPNSIEINANGNTRQTRIANNNQHVLSDVESPYGPVEPIYGGSMAGTPRRTRPSMPPPAPPAPSSLSPPTANHTPTRSALPPPPPPPEGTSPPPMMNGAASPPPPPQLIRTALDAHLDHMHQVIGMMSAEPAECEAPPPPPPPPPPVAPQSERAPEGRPPAPSAAALLLGASALKAAPQPPPPPPDPRTDLLKSIRDGIKLRKVEKRGDDSTGRYDTLRGAPGLHDVASILARRVAVELSDTDPDSNSDDSDSDGWGAESRA